jgi:seryl-tRNA synthetase
MNLDINCFREDKGADIALYKDSIKKRFRDPAIIDNIVALDKEWRHCNYFNILV